jgi:aspartate/methionine/tyrosine aminotransferase
MIFQKIDYIEWARTHMGHVRYDLAKSNVKALTREELGLTTLDDIDFNAKDGDDVDELRELLGKRYGVPIANILVTSGATMGIYLACSTILGMGDQALLESPNYEPLLRACQQVGAEIQSLERHFDRGFQIEIEELERRIGRATRAVVLTNLHNPSGVATGPEKMLSICQIARDAGATVIASEVYLDNAFVPGHKPAVSYGPHMVSIGSLSKVYGLGGIRIGWIVASEALIRKARLAFDYIECDLPILSVKIATIALRKAPELVLRCRQIVLRNIKIVGEWVAKHGDLQWVEPEGGTVCMVKLPPGVDAQELSTLLRENHSTLVVPGDFFSIRGFIRISCGTDEEILRQGLKNVSKGIDQIKALHL